VLVSSCARFGNAPDASGDAQSARAVRQIVQSGTHPDYVTRDRDGARVWKLVGRFYSKRDFAPAWIHNRQSMPQMDA